MRRERGGGEGGGGVFGDSILIRKHRQTGDSWERYENGTPYLGTVPY